MEDQQLDNLWLARTLFELGAIRFGDFTLGRSTIHSPIYVDLRGLLSNPSVLRLAARLIKQETALEQSLLHPKCEWFDLVAGVPFGGLHLATAFSLDTNVPMIYARPSKEGTGEPNIEGRFTAGQTVLVIDDLITRGRSVIQTTAILRGAGLRVRDAIVLVDREQGAAQRLKLEGVNLIPILKLKVMLNLYAAEGLITEEQAARCFDYLHANQGAETDEDDGGPNGDRDQQPA